MKVLKKKLKKVPFFKKFCYILTLLLYIGCFGYFVYGVLKLKNIENLIRSILIAVFAVWTLIYFLAGMITLISKKNGAFIGFTIITLLFCPVLGGSSYFINHVYGKIENINKDTLEYSTYLVSLKETKFDSNSGIGIVKGSDKTNIEGYSLGKKLLAANELKNKIYEYDDYVSLLADLDTKKIDAAILPSTYKVDMDHFDEDKENVDVPFRDRVKVLYTYSEEEKNMDDSILEHSKDKKLTEPFTVLVMGVDSAIDGLKKNQAFNGDTLILVTFNPNTLTSTMLSIPRDLYVPIACNHNRYAKINSSAAYGTSCVINTVQNLTDIKIDFYLKINFTGVVQLVDALDGITVDVQEPNFNFNGRRDCRGMVCEQNSRRQFGNEMIYVPVGVNKLNGEQALAYARNRHQYALSDIARNQHQQQIIEAIASKVKDIRSTKQVEDLLNTVSNNILTNMQPEQIMSFYNVGKDMLAGSTSNTLSIKKTYLNYYNLPVWLKRPERYTIALGYFPESLEAINKAMRLNLGMENFI